MAVGEAGARLRECDIVMKGGITSGVVYPKAITELSARFRFRSIGGTSAGAIAAVGAAAAEFRRHATGDAAGFTRLAGLTDWLGAQPAGSRQRNLERLFRADRSTAPLFRLVRAAQTRGVGAKLRGVAAAVPTGYPKATLLGLLVAAPVVGALVWAGTALAGRGAFGVAAAVALGLAGLLLTLVAVLVVVGVAVSRSVLRDVPDNMLGICSGHSDDSTEEHPALTDWLDQVVQEVAGLRTGWGPTAGERPLTFGDLWTGRQGPPGEQARRRAADRPGERVVDLRMMTTCLTLATPYMVPFGMDGFWFRPSEMRRLFPGYVVDHLVRTSSSTRRGAACPAVDGEALCRWPVPADVPVVVAARMSLSFPVLVSTVPLWAADYVRPENVRAARKKDDAALVPERCFFTDGGVSSNFPLHMFDTMLPRRPTFGIDLRPFHPAQPRHEHDQTKNVGMVEQYGEGGAASAWWRRLERLDLVDGAPVRGRPRLGRFGAVLVDTMKHWQDDALARVPGYRERVVRVYQDEDEGGLNLDMDATRIRNLALRGEAAARRLIKAYGGAPDGVGPMDVCWQTHRWMRFRASMAALEEAFAGLREAWDDDALGPGVLPYAELVARDQVAGPNRLRGEQVDFVRRRTTELMGLVSSWLDEIDPAKTGDPRAAGRAFGYKTPQPPPELRLRPRL